MKDWLAERVLLEEVPASRRDEVAAARGTRALEDQLAALRASNDDVLAELPPARVAAEVERRLRARGVAAPRAPRWILWAAPAAVAVAALLLVIARPGDRALVADDGVRTKGDPILRVHRKVGDGAELLSAGATVRAGDQLQLSYVAAGRPFGAILSIDGRGAVTVHHPARGTRAAALDSSDGAHALPFAYELDDAPGFERFFFITSDLPFDLAVAVEAAQPLAADPESARTAPLALPRPLHHSSLLLIKGPRP